MNDIYQGETLLIETVVKDAAGAPANLTGAEAFFACSSSTGVVVLKPCAIEGSLVKTELTAEETSIMTGAYSIEIKLRDLDGRVDSIVAVSFKVKKSIIPVLPKPVPQT